MVRHVSKLSVFVVGSLFLVILFVSHRLVISGTLDDNSFQTIGRSIQSWSINNEVDHLDQTVIDDNITAEIESVVTEQRRLIEAEMQDYPYSSPDNDVLAK